MRCPHGARRTHALPARWSYRQIQDTDLYVDVQFMILCIYFYEYRQKQSQILKNVHIFLAIQANTGKYELSVKCICACMWFWRSFKSAYIFRNTGKYRIGSWKCAYISQYTGKYRILICMWMNNSWYCAHIFMNTGKYRLGVYIYLNIQANTTYRLICECTIHEAVHIIVWIQANTGTDYEKSAYISHNTGKYRQIWTPREVHICLYLYICHMHYQTYRHIWTTNRI
jgi:hypothetical protein